MERMTDHGGKSPKSQCCGEQKPEQVVDHGRGPDSRGRLAACYSQNAAIRDLWLWRDHSSGEEFGQADETKESDDPDQLGCIQ